MLNLHPSPVLAAAILSLLTTPVLGVDTCSTDASRWDYWWYGSGPRYNCAEHNVCHISHIDQRTIGWSVTQGGSLGFNLAKSAALGFQSSYTWSESTTTGTTYSVDYYPPETERLWIKQWFAVLDMTCQSCDWVCYPMGQSVDNETDTGLNVGGQHCDRACDPHRHVIAWVPCRDSSCTEYQFSNADAQCDHSNHCQQN
ncbi:hypothetical protein CCM_09398 [Cordyceps militaris CM01]|uniref:Uncharacterized protein n=1 Tax=Cordyceps militaris (strain CM01) TaxID=983644 RepID=G3JU55_CORMM|nr:uncharacterized protein CCM_09398 [Cordyceps militaris CM01]EGX87776.1 hypothetical protein CCM_09398 [Cordyceps militaris CM01]